MAKKRIKLSKSKQKWVNTGPTAVMRGSALNYPVGIEERYRKQVAKILDDVMKEANREVVRLFKSRDAVEFFTSDASIATLANRALDQLFARLEKMSRHRAQITAESMVGKVNKTSASAMASSLKTLSGMVTLRPKLLGGDIEVLLRAAIDVNVDLIVSIARQHLGKIKDAVNRSIMLGNGLQDLVPFMQKQRGITKRHGRNVALDQTRKAYSSLNLERMKQANISKFMWLHSGGGQVPRKFHKDMFPAGLNHGVYDVNDPPVIDTKTEEKGYPAQLPNCKCRMVPVIVLDDGTIL